MMAGRILNTFKRNFLRTQIYEYKEVYMLHNNIKQKLINKL